MEEVVVSAYDPGWIMEYEQEKETLTKLLEDIIQGIEHIGSTAVPGLAAKPVIDIMVGVNDLHHVTEQHIQKLGDIGYEFVEHPHFPERRFFRRGPWRAGTHHLHIYQYESENWNFNLLFRNYLIHHPDTRNEYSKLKKELEEKYKKDRPGYTKAKAPFIEKVIKLAELEIKK
jgi:GrpB-like predicted nucleotidyltransferase (UPF0157 family)